MTPSEGVEKIREKIFMWLDFYNSSEMTEASDMENELVKIVVDLISQAKEEGRQEERERIWQVILENPKALDTKSVTFMRKTLSEKE